MKGKKRERILRILLKHPDGSLSKYRISKEACCSFPWVHSFLKKLENKKLIDNTKVLDVIGTFDYWLQISKNPQMREYQIQKPLDLLKKTKLKFALTTYYAESFIQNYLFPSRVDIYIRWQDPQEWHKLLSLKGLVGKGNFRILIDDEHVFYSNIKKKGYRIVSIPQLILDLLKEQGVAVEAAELLMEREYHAFISKV